MRPCHLVYHVRAVCCLPHRHRDWAHPHLICTGTGLTPTTSATSAPGLGSPPPHLHRDGGRCSALRRDLQRLVAADKDDRSMTAAQRSRVYWTSIYNAARCGSAKCVAVQVAPYAHLQTSTNAHKCTHARARARTSLTHGTRTHAHLVHADTRAFMQTHVHSAAKRSIGR